jgi:hypothetical protein
MRILLLLALSLPLLGCPPPGHAAIAPQPMAEVRAARPIVAAAEP